MAPFSKSKRRSLRLLKKDSNTGDSTDQRILRSNKRKAASISNVSEHSIHKRKERKSTGDDRSLPGMLVEDTAISESQLEGNPGWWLHLVDSALPGTVPITERIINDNTNVENATLNSGWYNHLEISGPSFSSRKSHLSSAHKSISKNELDSPQVDSSPTRVQGPLRKKIRQTTPRYSNAFEDNTLDSSPSNKQKLNKKFKTPQNVLDLSFDSTSSENILTNYKVRPLRRKQTENKKVVAKIFQKAFEDESDSENMNSEKSTATKLIETNKSPDQDNSPVKSHRRPLRKATGKATVAAKNFEAAFEDDSNATESIHGKSITRKSTPVNKSSDQDNSPVKSHRRPLRKATGKAAVAAKNFEAAFEDDSNATESIPGKPITRKSTPVNKSSDQDNSPVKSHRRPLRKATGKATVAAKNFEAAFEDDSNVTESIPGKPITRKSTPVNKSSDQDNSPVKSHRRPLRKATGKAAVAAKNFEAAFEDDSNATESIPGKPITRKSTPVNKSSDQDNSPVKSHRRPLRKATGKAAVAAKNFEAAFEDDSNATESIPGKPITRKSTPVNKSPDQDNSPVKSQHRPLRKATGKAAVAAKNFEAAFEDDSDDSETIPGKSITRKSTPVNKSPDQDNSPVKSQHRPLRKATGKAAVAAKNFEAAFEDDSDDSEAIPGKSITGKSTPVNKSPDQDNSPVKSQHRPLRKATGKAAVAAKNFEAAFEDDSDDSESIPGKSITRKSISVNKSSDQDNSPVKSQHRTLKVSTGKATVAAKNFEAAFEDDSDDSETIPGKSITRKSISVNKSPHQGNSPVKSQHRPLKVSIGKAAVAAKNFEAAFEDDSDVSETIPGKSITRKSISDNKSPDQGNSPVKSQHQTLKVSTGKATVAAKNFEAAFEVDSDDIESIPGKSITRKSISDNKFPDQDNSPVKSQHRTLKVSRGKATVAAKNFEAAFEVDSDDIESIPGKSITRKSISDNKSPDHDNSPVKSQHRPLGKATGKATVAAKNFEAAFEDDSDDSETIPGKSITRKSISVNKSPHQGNSPAKSQHRTHKVSIGKAAVAAKNFEAAFEDDSDDSETIPGKSITRKSISVNKSPHQGNSPVKSQHRPLKVSIGKAAVAAKNFEAAFEDDSDDSESTPGKSITTKSISVNKSPHQGNSPVKSQHRPLKVSIGKAAVAAKNFEAAFEDDSDDSETIPGKSITRKSISVNKSPHQGNSPAKSQHRTHKVSIGKATVAAKNFEAAFEDDSDDSETIPGKSITRKSISVNKSPHQGNSPVKSQHRPLKVSIGKAAVAAKNFEAAFEDDSDDSESTPGKSITTKSISVNKSPHQGNSPVKSQHRPLKVSIGKAAVAAKNFEAAFEVDSDDSETIPGKSITRKSISVNKSPHQGNSPVKSQHRTHKVSIGKATVAAKNFEAAFEDDSDDSESIPGKSITRKSISVNKSPDHDNSPVKSQHRTLTNQKKHKSSVVPKYFEDDSDSGMEPSDIRQSPSKSHVSLRNRSEQLSPVYVTTGKSHPDTGTLKDLRSDQKMTGKFSATAKNVRSPLDNISTKYSLPNKAKYETRAAENTNLTIETTQHYQKENIQYHSKSVRSSDNVSANSNQRRITSGDDPDFRTLDQNESLKRKEAIRNASLAAETAEAKTFLTQNALVHAENVDVPCGEDTGDEMNKGSLEDESNSEETIPYVTRRKFLQVNEPDKQEIPSTEFESLLITEKIPTPTKNFQDLEASDTSTVIYKETLPTQHNRSQQRPLRKRTKANVIAKDFEGDESSVSSITLPELNPKRYLKSVEFPDNIPLSEHLHRPLREKQNASSSSTRKNLQTSDHTEQTHNINYPVRVNVMNRESPVKTLDVANVPHPVIEKFHEKHNKRKSSVIGQGPNDDAWSSTTELSFIFDPVAHSTVLEMNAATPQKELFKRKPLDGIGRNINAPVESPFRTRNTNKNMENVVFSDKFPKKTPNTGQKKYDTKSNTHEPVESPQDPSGTPKSSRKSSRREERNDDFKSSTHEPVESPQDLLGHPKSSRKSSRREERNDDFKSSTHEPVESPRDPSGGPKSSRKSFRREERNDDSESSTHEPEESPRDPSGGPKSSRKSFRREERNDDSESSTHEPGESPRDPSGGPKSSRKSFRREERNDDSESSTHEPGESPRDPSDGPKSSRKSFRREERNDDSESSTHEPGESPRDPSDGPKSSRKSFRREERNDDSESSTHEPEESPRDPSSGPKSSRKSFRREERNDDSESSTHEPEESPRDPSSGPKSSRKSFRREERNDDSESSTHEPEESPRDPSDGPKSSRKSFRREERNDDSESSTEGRVQYHSANAKRSRKEKHFGVAVAELVIPSNNTYKSLMDELANNQPGTSLRMSLNKNYEQSPVLGRLEPITKKRSVLRVDSAAVGGADKTTQIHRNKDKPKSSLHKEVVDTETRRVTSVANIPFSEIISLVDKENPNLIKAITKLNESIEASQNIRTGKAQQGQKASINTIDYYFPKTNNVSRVELKRADIVKRPTQHVNPKLLVNGKPYRAPRLAKPKQWVTKRLYNLIIKECEHKYGLVRSRKKAEDFILYLCSSVALVMRRKVVENYKHVVSDIKKQLFLLGVIRSQMDFFIFIEDYLPQEFREKVIPCLRAYGKVTGIKLPSTIDLYADLEFY